MARRGKAKQKRVSKPVKLEQASKDYRLVSREEEKMPVELSTEERDRASIRLAELVGEKEALLEEKRDVVREWRVRINAKQEEIDDCAAGVLKGAMPTKFVVETRAVYRTRMIERVRAQDGVVVDARPMTPEEEVQYLQTDIEGQRTQPAALLREPAPEAVDDEPEAVAGDVLSDDECDAARVPHGWPKAWMDRRWKVEGAALPLTGADVAQVFYSLSASGSTLDELVAEGAPAAYLGRPHVSRAIALLNRRDLVVKSEDGAWFARLEAPAETVEPGRNDPLPEASAAPKPKRRRARDTGEQAINVALGQSEAMEAGA